MWYLKVVLICLISLDSGKCSLYTGYPDTRLTGRRAAAPPRARRGTLRALRYAARPAARALRGGAAPGAVRCGARRAARAEHLTVSIAHGSLTRRPFLLEYYGRVSC